MDKIAFNREASEKKQIRRGEVIADREVVHTIAPVLAWTTPGACWGIGFDPSGGLYASIEAGDIYYRPPGGSFAALSQTTRTWQEISVAPNGNVYCVDFGAGIYVRVAGAGNFGLLEAGGFTCVACSPNGNIYALKGNQLYRWDGASFVYLSQATRPYAGLVCAANNDVYATVYGTGKIYLMAGGTGNFVELSQTVQYCWNLAAAPNGDIFLAPYSGYDFNIYRRAGGAGDFEIYTNLSRYPTSMAVSTGGALYVSTVYYTEYYLYMINDQSVTQQPVNTIVQNKAVPEKNTQPKSKNLKPYDNKTYGAMQHYVTPVKFTGRQRDPEPDKRLPVLVGHIEEISRFVRLGNPVVISIPTTSRDPVSRVEVQGGGDGMASVSPSGLSVIYKPGSTSTALLVVHTKNGQQCTATLMAK